MGPDMTVWQMVMQIERELVQAKAARNGLLGEPPRRPWRLPWLERRRRSSPVEPGTDTVPVRGSLIEAGHDLITRRLSMKWVTRARPVVDRIACPWLIRRFVDPEAEFLFVAPSDVLAVAAREEAIPYDVPGVELGHHGDRCSFDAIISKYNLTDPALLDLAQIVRGADMDARRLTPESAGLYAIARGFQLAYEDDHEQLEREWPVYDALYAFCRKRAGYAVAS